MQYTETTVHFKVTLANLITNEKKNLIYNVDLKQCTTTIYLPSKISDIWVFEAFCVELKIPEHSPKSIFKIWRYIHLYTHNLINIHGTYNIYK